MLVLYVCVWCVFFGQGKEELWPGGGLDTAISLM